MLHAILFICHDSAQIHIFHAAEYIGFHKRIDLLQGFDQFLDLHAFGTVFIVIACCTCIRKLACTLNEMQIIVITPCLDSILADQIQRADQLHPFKICAVQLWHHGLHLSTIQHSH